MKSNRIRTDELGFTLLISASADQSSFAPSSSNEAGQGEAQHLASTLEQGFPEIAGPPASTHQGIEPVLHVSSFKQFNSLEAA